MAVAKRDIQQMYFVGFSNQIAVAESVVSQPGHSAFSNVILVEERKQE